MSTALSPLVSEFETEEQEASYTAWLKAVAGSPLAMEMQTPSSWRIEKPSFW